MSNAFCIRVDMDVEQSVNIAVDYVAEMEQFTRSKDSCAEDDDLQFLGGATFLYRGHPF